MKEPLAAYEMPLYRSHKKVRALEIKGFEPNPANDGYWLHFCEEGFPSLAVESTMFARYKPIAGDFFVQYEDGYQLISPRHAFLEGYKKADELDPGVQLARMNGLVTPFAPHTMVSEDSLVVDKYGIAWWVRPRAMQIIKAGRPHVLVHKDDPPVHSSYAPERRPTAEPA